MDITLHRSPNPKITVFNPDAYEEELGLHQIRDFDENSEKKKAISDYVKKPMDDRAVRYRYLCKLTYKGVWQEKPKAQNLIIFDWDDTLFPTSAFMPRCKDDLYRIRKRHADILAKLDDVIVDLMKSAVVEGNQVALVTNARLTWVYYSSLLLLPKTANLLRGQVKVVTARVDGLDIPSSKWKIKCFMILFEELGFSIDAVTNLIVVGDSMNEI